MSNEAKKEEGSTLNRPWTEPGEEVRIIHRIPTGMASNRLDEKGQPKLTDGKRSVSWLMGCAQLTHEEVCKIYLDAQEREAAARTVREFWGTVMQNWVDLTEPVD